mmetsp:Transcript_18406/g.33300  ORF Transcript_18406/g.33300 Transcript_18406/m.33300 type:complete len:144 (-) Transcript_18406:119-550(-)
MHSLDKLIFYHRSHRVGEGEWGDTRSGAIPGFERIDVRGRRYNARAKRSQVPTQHVRGLLLRRTRLHATIEISCIGRSSSCRCWDNVGDILGLSSDKNFYLAFKIVAIATTDRERGCGRYTTTMSVQIDEMYMIYDEYESTET